MFKSVLIIFLFPIVGLVTFSYFNSPDNMQTTDQFADQIKNTLSINGVEIKIEIADESNEQSRGLSGREYLAPDGGMLFVFPERTIPGFWMKEMNFSLDFIWIDESGKIVEITKNVSPATYPKTFLPPSPIKYVLEVNAGWSDKNNIKIGNVVSF